MRTLVETRTRMRELKMQEIGAQQFHSCPHCREPLYVILFVSEGTEFTKEGEWPWTTEVVSIQESARAEKEAP